MTMIIDSMICIAAIRTEDAFSPPFFLFLMMHVTFDYISSTFYMSQTQKYTADTGTACGLPLISNTTLHEVVCICFWTRHGAPLFLVQRDTPQFRISSLVFSRDIDDFPWAGIIRVHPPPVNALRELQAAVMASGIGIQKKMSLPVKNEVTYIPD